MEYMQMTLNDWINIKESLKRDLIGVQESFVRIGYKLRKIEEQNLYEKDGCKSIAEFAKVEYGLTSSTVSRFMAINRKYSIDGYSDQLRPEFAQLGSSKLSEMLSLPDQDMQMITPETTREDIRELKQFNREEPQPQIADNIRELVEKFFQENPDSLNELFSEPADVADHVQRTIEIIVPSGNKVFRKGLYFMTMTETDIKIKKYGEAPQTMTWEKFLNITQSIFGDAAAGPKTWQRYFAAEEEKMKDDTGGEETGQKHSESIAAGTSDEPERAQSQGEEIAPAQKNPEILEQEDNLDDEDKGTTTGKSTEQEHEQETETAAGEETEETESGTEIVDYMNMPEKAYGTRKGYMDTLTAQDMAIYISEEYKGRRLMVSSLAFPSELEKWLLQEVDERGKEVLEAWKKEKSPGSSAGWKYPVLSRVFDNVRPQHQRKM